MFKPFEVTNVNGEIENLNLSQIVKSFDNITDDGATVTVIQFADGDTTVITGDDREKFIALENVYKEATRAEAWQIAEQIDAAIKAQQENSQTA
jgi:K+/H+ antiporter YhaU regulatory subunit KhtT